MPPVRAYRKPNGDLTEVNETPVLIYEDWRDRLQDGDVLLYRGSGWVSRTIMRLTAGRFSHAALVGQARGRYFTVQFREGAGGVILPLSYDVSRHIVYVYRWCDDTDATPEKRAAMMDWAFTQSGRPYSYRELIRFWLHIRLGMRFIALPMGREDRPNFCSQFVAEAARQFLDVQIKIGSESSLISPADLDAAWNLEPLGRLVMRQDVRERDAIDLPR